MPRFFISSDNITYPITTDDKLYITGSDAMHICAVLRMNCGDKLVVCDMKRNEYLCEILSATKERIELLVLEVSYSQNEPDVYTVLYQGIAKGDKMDTVIQKAVELGASKIVPVDCERSVVKLSEDKADKKVLRWQKIAFEAAKQCGRGIIPEIGNVIPFSQCVKELCEFEKHFACYEGENIVSIKNIIKGNDYKNCGFFIGPEGGISAVELELLQKARVPSVTLGKLILRTETAGSAVLAMLLYERQL